MTGVASGYALRYPSMFSVGLAGASFGFVAAMAIMHARSGGRASDRPAASAEDLTADSPFQLVLEPVVGAAEQLVQVNIAGKARIDRSADGLDACLLDSLAVLSESPGQVNVWGQLAGDQSASIKCEALVSNAARAKIEQWAQDRAGIDQGVPPERSVRRKKVRDLGLSNSELISFHCLDDQRVDLAPVRRLLENIRRELDGVVVDLSLTVDRLANHIGGEGLALVGFNEASPARMRGSIRSWERPMRSVGWQIGLLNQS